MREAGGGRAERVGRGRQGMAVNTMDRFLGTPTQFG